MSKKETMSSAAEATDAAAAANLLHFDSKPYNQKHIFIKNPVHMFVTKSHGAANLLWSVHPLQLPGLL